MQGEEIILRKIFEVRTIRPKSSREFTDLLITGEDIYGEEVSIVIENYTRGGSGYNQFQKHYDHPL